MSTATVIAPKRRPGRHRGRLTTPVPLSERPAIVDDRWYSAKEAAAALATSAKGIQREHKAGRLKGAVINQRGDLRFKGIWLQEWLDAQAQVA